MSWYLCLTQFQEHPCQLWNSKSNEPAIKDIKGDGEKATENVNECTLYYTLYTGGVASHIESDIVFLTGWM